MRKSVLSLAGLLLFGCVFCDASLAQTKFYQYYQKGLDYLKEGDSQRALDQFESAASLEFEDKTRKRIYGTRFIEYYPHYQMARIYDDLRELENARREIELSLAFANNNDDAKALLERLGLSGQSGRSSEATVTSPPAEIAPPTFEPPAPTEEPEPPSSIGKSTAPLEETKTPPATELVMVPVALPEPRPAESAATKLGYDPAEVPRVGERLTIAVLPFTQQGGEGSLSVQATDDLINELVNFRRFTILDRNALEKLLDEQALNLSGIVDEKQAVEAGKLAGADAIIIGTLAISPGRSKVQAKVIDTETSETLAARDSNTRESDPASIETEIAKLAILIFNDLPLVTGNVIEVGGDQVYLDLGADLNVRRGTKCVVYHEGEPVLHPKTHEILGVRRELITEVVITDVQPKMSIAKIIPNTGAGQVAAGDKVVVK